MSNRPTRPVGGRSDEGTVRTMTDASMIPGNSDSTSAPRLASIGVHPIKSLAGLAPTRWWFGPRGPVLDRRWMLIDRNGRFISLREVPGLARFKPLIIDPSSGTGLAGEITETRLPRLRIEHDGSSFEFEPRQDGDRRSAVLWKADRIVIDEGDTAATWFSSRLDRPVRLVRHQPELDPWTQAEPEADGATTGLSDGYPVLVVTRATIAAAVGPMMSERRFRANLVIDGAAASSEDRWRRLRIGELELELVKPCVRCVATTVDPETGVRTGTAPLSTQARTRLWNGKPVMGWNTLVRKAGPVQVGDPVEIVETRPRTDIVTEDF